MAGHSKPQELPQLESGVLPRGLDLLNRDQERSNLAPEEVYKRFPALTMIAEILTDFIATKLIINPDDINVSLLERHGAAGISFSSRSHADGSVSSDINDTLLKAFEVFAQTARLHKLDESNQFILMPENFFIGATGGKMGVVQFLYALAEDHDVHIGIDTRGKRKQSIGHFTLSEVIVTLEEEIAQRKKIAQGFSGAAAPLDPIDVVETAGDIAETFGKSLDAAMGGEVFRGAFYAHLNGYRLGFFPDDAPGHREKVDELFEKLEGISLPAGAKISREYWSIAVDSKETMEQMMNIALALYPVPEEIPEASPEDADGTVFVWDRPDPVEPLAGVIECLQGLCKFHYDTGDAVDWIPEFQDDICVIRAHLADGAEDLAQNIQDMLSDMQNNGGDWDGLSVLPRAYAIEIHDIKLFPLMLEKYALKESVYFGIEALEKCPIDGYDEEEELGAALAIEGDIDGDDPEADEIKDLTLINLLGHQQYGSPAEMRKDVAKLLRLMESDIYGGPIGHNEIFKLLKDEPGQKLTHAQLLEGLKAPSPEGMN